MKQLDNMFFEEVFNLYKENISSKIKDETYRELNENIAYDALNIFCLAMNKMIEKDYFSEESKPRE